MQIHVFLTQIYQDTIETTPDLTRKSSKPETKTQEHTHFVQTQKPPKSKLDPCILDF